MKKSIGANTFLPTTPVLLVGTYDKDKKPNLMTAAWGGICCSKPPCLSVSLRKATYSYAGILERQSFTVGVPSASQVKEADFIGMVSGSKMNKFAEIPFTPVKSGVVDAPYAAEIPFVLECKLVHSAELGLHTLFVGEIVDIKIDESMLADDGLPDISKLQPIVYDPIHRGYHGVGEFLGKGFSVGKR